MATRKRSGAAGRAKSSSSRATGIPAGMVEGVQQIWLAGMGALARAQRDGPAAFHDAVTEGLKLLERSRSGAGQLVRDAIDTAQGSMQARIDSAMSQANETWDSLETLFQNRVQRALMQIGVPTAEEVRKLTRRVADLNESVKALSQRQATPRKRGKARRARNPGFDQAPAARLIDEGDRAHARSATRRHPVAQSSSIRSRVRAARRRVAEL